MTLPDKIVKATEHLPFADKAQVYAALVAYIATETEPYVGLMSENAKAFFDLSLDVLRPILRRRKRDAARRARKRREREEQKKAANRVNETVEPEASEQAATEASPSEVPQTLPSGVTGEPTPCEIVDDKPEMTVPDDSVRYDDIEDPRMKIRAVYRRITDNTELRNNTVSYLISRVFPLSVVVDHNASGYYRLEDRFKSKKGRKR